jgi:hypothetical protein
MIGLQRVPGVFQYFPNSHISIRAKTEFDFITPQSATGRAHKKVTVEEGQRKIGRSIRKGLEIPAD